MSTPADRPASRASASTSADPFMTAPNTPATQLRNLDVDGAQSHRDAGGAQSPKVEAAEEARGPHPRPGAAPSAAAPAGAHEDTHPTSSSASDTSDRPAAAAVAGTSTGIAASNLGGGRAAPTTLEPPSAPFTRAAETPSGSLAGTPRNSFPFTSASTNNSAPLLNETEKAQAADVSTDNSGRSRAEAGGAATAGSGSPRGGKKRGVLRRPLFWILALLALAVVVIVIVVPVYFKVVKPKNAAAAAATNPSNPQSPTGATTGGDGSTVITANGSTFTYNNAFGGFWVEDPNDPFNNDAKPNSWTPPLNTSWTWGKDMINGVNLGGLFVLEPFIAPSLFQKYNGSVDEWTLSTLMAQDTAGGGLSQIEDHYNTFITEQDIAEIAGAGLNWIRVPIPFWAIEKWDFEPFLEKVCWPYILRVLQWARKYGLRVNLDLHTIPGSQNGYNHSGKLGSVNFLNGVMGLANAERTLNYIRIIAEFISQPEWQPVVPVFSIVNEALLTTIGKDQLTSFYLQAHDMIREITGYGAGHGAYIAIHDGFVGTANWTGFLQGSDRIILDTHPYFAFDGQPNDAPLATGDGAGGPGAGGTWPQTACGAWAAGMNESQAGFGVTIAGEFSNGYNDCGLYLSGVADGATVTGECELFLDYQSWNETMKAGFMEFTLASMDSLQNYFYWTWKIGPSQSGAIESPQWSYQLGLAEGWIPKDPRAAVGTCASLGVSGPIFNGTYEPWQTGGLGAGTIAPSSVSAYGSYPPFMNGLTAGAVQSLLPTYTSTSAVPTLPAPTSLRTNGGSWYDASDTGGAPTEVAGCSYTWDAWDATSTTMPTALCTGSGSAKRAAVTPPPERRGW